MSDLERSLDKLLSDRGIKSLDDYLAQCAAASEQSQIKQYGVPFAVAFDPAIHAAELELYAEAKRKAEEKLTAGDREPWVVINTLPWPLNVDGLVHKALEVGGIQVPACPIEEKWGVRFVIRDVLWSMRDHGHPTSGSEPMLPWEPVPHVPLELAKEYQILAEAQGWQGVVAFQEENASEPSARLAIQKAKNLRNYYLYRVYEYATAYWNNPVWRNWITNHERNAAKVLLAEEIIDALPEWAT